ncbi:hypothetical protein GCM10010260_82420 [Streptomyces filipinensis]|uniref:Uncharacterized protein n=1 Tax=Streptomyces filipinensis TaxID=66887 RepID=A0A918MGJ6_9ACTN|nr:hypothetical protein [Streptomyces filipinensis]GGV29427.1 hypothetical protein GCM10010260_82420 [Streptomyces filipinensis]
MTVPEESPAPAVRLAALCFRLEKAEGPLGAEGPVRDQALNVVAAVRAGAGAAELRALLDTLEEALRTEGLPYGLDAGAFRSAPTDPRYGPLRGLQPRGVHAVFCCPAAEPLRCSRAQRATWAARATPPGCPVHDLPLREERLKL